MTTVAAACQLHLWKLPAARRTLGRWSVSKVRSENGGHGCRRLYGWDSMDAGLIAIGTRADTTNALFISINHRATMLLANHRSSEAEGDQTERLASPSPRRWSTSGGDEADAIEAQGVSIEV